ncbi:MAG: TolC family protein [Synergistaceae bacterium]|nr:TolC family protein [Synergistaceae bacterium]
MNRSALLLILTVLFTAILGAGSLFAAEAPGVPISLEECLALAEAHHPALEEARAALAGQRARLGGVDAGLALKGNLSASTSKDSGSDGSYSTSLSVSKLISDSGKTALERKSQLLSVEGATESQRETLLSVRIGVKEAYWGLLLAMRKRDQAEESVMNYGRHLEKATGFYEAGAKAKFDVTKAEVDLSNARIDLLSAESGLDTARAALSRAVGADLDHARPLSDFMEPIIIPGEDLALSRAMEDRPDVRSARFKTEAGRLVISIAAKGNAASLSVTGSARLSGTGLPPDDNLSVGLSLSVPVFDGGATKYKVAEARASAEGLDATLKKLEQTVIYEVRSALLAVKEAEARIGAAELLVRQARENLDLAEGRYEMGVGNALEVADGLLSFNSARVSRYQALHDYSKAVATLEKTLGGEFE